MLRYSYKKNTVSTSNDLTIEKELLSITNRITVLPEAETHPLLAAGTGSHAHKTRTQQMPSPARIDQFSPLEIYTAYARDDERFFKKIKEQLNILQRQGWPLSCHESEIIYSAAWRRSDHLATMATANSKKVFVVYGRNKHVMLEMFAFLKMLRLSPIPWEEAVLSTSKSASYIGETLDTLLQQAQAVVVLLTGDDEAQLRSELIINGESGKERILFPQPRLNVMFEVGMAFSHNWLAHRTILVEAGKVRICRTLEGRHRIKLSNKMEDRWALIRSLETAGCAVEIPSFELVREVGNFNFE